LFEGARVADLMLVQAGPLRAFAADIFRKAGLADDQAAVTADALVWADLRGHPSHGVMRVPPYVGWIDGGLIKAKAIPKVVLRKGAVVKIDGESAAGPAAMVLAADTAIAHARDNAVAWVLVENHIHAGALGFYASRVAEAGMVGMAMSALRPMMAYHGTRGAAASTNPLAVAVPGGIMLDMSTSTSSRGKINVARVAGKDLPPGIAIDRDGRPTTDPNAATTLTPMAGPKGAGLSLMIECLSSIALGHALVAPALSDSKLMTDYRQNSLVIAMDPGVVGSVEAFSANVQALAREVKVQPRADGFDEILMPGERGAREAARRGREGISIPGKTWQQIADVAAKYGVTPPDGN
jgi:LDH2 family malate/lactate/ureidoglycolate dehydrogenase